MRETVEFLVLREVKTPAGEVGLEYLHADRTWGPEDGAAVFRFRVGATGRERLQIDDEIRRGCGGRDAAARLFAEQAVASTAVRERLRATMNEAERARLDVAAGGGQAFEALLGALAHDDLHRAECALLVDLNEQIAALRFMAEWRVLQASVPRGWEDIGDIPFEDAETLRAINAAYMRALGGARVTPGKGRSPGS